MISSWLQEVDAEEPLSKLCRNVSNTEDDRFVGILTEYKEKKLHAVMQFPLGFRISKEDEDVREDIMLLLTVLQQYNLEESEFLSIGMENNPAMRRFPIKAYQYVITEYLRNGYYQIREEAFQKGQRGPVHWPHTVKKESPIAQNNGIVFLSYQIKAHNKSEKDLITEISRYCVFQSYLRLGWIYKLRLPQKPIRKYSNSVYINYLHSLLQRTNRDQEILLFQSMLEVLRYEEKENNPYKTFWGTNSFHNVWESLVNDTYGIDKKERYYPKTKWVLKEYGKKDNYVLQPDTIMIKEKHLFVIDAKYYRYGITSEPQHLPGSMFFLILIQFL